jgi:CheY-like chemotaxis protein
MSGNMADAVPSRLPLEVRRNIGRLRALGARLMFNRDLRLLREMQGIRTDVAVRSEDAAAVSAWPSPVRSPPWWAAASTVAADADAERILRRSFAGRRVLLAEDNPVNSEIARMILEEVDLRVDVAEDGEQALHLAGTHHYDLILMDMQMPRMDGLAATLAIRRLPDYADRPIVAMTANAFVEDKQRCIAAGMDDFIAKPVDPDVLFSVVLRWLDPDLRPPPPQ